MCHVSHVTCHVLGGTCHIFSYFASSVSVGQNGEASRWKVCYQRGLPRQVFSERGGTPVLIVPEVDKKLHKFTLAPSYSHSFQHPLTI